MDYIAQQFISAIGKFRKQLQEIKEAIEKSAESRKQADISPPILRAELQIPDVVFTHKEAPDTQKERRERFKVRVQTATLIAVAVYTGVAALQWCEMKKAAEQTRTALHVSERAYLTIGGPSLDTEKGVVTLSISNGGRIPSGNGEVVVHEATVNQAATVLPPDARNVVEQHWSRIPFESATPGNPFSITIVIPAFSKPRLEAGTQSIRHSRTYEIQ